MIKSQYMCGIIILQVTSISKNFLKFWSPQEYSKIFAQSKLVMGFYSCKTRLMEEKVLM